MLPTVTIKWISVFNLLLAPASGFHYPNSRKLAHLGQSGVRISKNVHVSSNHQNNNWIEASENDDAESRERRRLLQIAALATLGTSSFAMEARADQPSSQEVLLRLRSIPTFCLVNPDGIPFMIFDGQYATGYFFLSFDIALRALDDARKKDNKGSAEIWSNTKIVVIPLAVALQLAIRKTEREAKNNGSKIITFNDIVPSAEGAEAAKELDGGDKGKWSVKGRVPLFFIDRLRLENGREPRYFNRIDLLREWQRQKPDQNPPPIQIVDLVDLYRSCITRNDISKVSNLAIMPVAETNELASNLYKSSDGNLPKYDFGKVVLVGSA